MDPTALRTSGSEAVADGARMRWWWVPLLIAVPAIVVVPSSFPAGRPVERLVHVQASMTGFTPAEIRVGRGDRVTLELTATDVVHGLYLDGYGLSVTAEPGRSGSVTFVADRPGVFRMRCSVTCGNLHPFLIGKVAVGNNGLLWRALGLAVLLVTGTLARWRR